MSTSLSSKRLSLGVYLRRLPLINQLFVPFSLSLFSPSKNSTCDLAQYSRKADTNILYFKCISSLFYRYLCWLSSLKELGSRRRKATVKYHKTAKISCLLFNRVCK